MNVLVIALARHVERLAFQRRQLEKLGLAHQFVDAVDAKSLSESEYQKLANTWERPMRRAEVGCFLSHTKAWQIVQATQQPALILEDDAFLASTVPAILKDLAAMQAVDFVTLEVHSRKKILSQTPAAILKSGRVLKLFQDRTGAAGYVLWPSGAKILLNEYLRGRAGLADAFIANNYQLRSFQFEPAAVIQLDICDRYGLHAPLLTVSSILTVQKPPSSGWFRWRRLSAQLRTARRFLSAMILKRAERRDVVLDRSVFENAAPTSGDATAKRTLSNIRISVCIVNCNTRDLLAICLNGLGARTLPADVEVIVVDNASTDGSADMVRTRFPQVTLLPQTSNRMFGPGMNAAIAHATGAYVLLLNSDTEVTVTQVRALADHLEKFPHVGACSPREKNAEGKLWPLPFPPPTVGRILLRALGGRKWLRRHLEESGPQESLTGSCLMLRRQVGEQVGWFDPGYVFYYEDTDLCAKIRAAGQELHIAPGVTTLHYHAASSRKVDRGQRLVWITNGFCRYVRKHHSPGSARWITTVALAVALVEMVGYAGITVLTLGVFKSLRQRARVGPQVAWMLARACWRRSE